LSAAVISPVVSLAADAGSGALASSSNVPAAVRSPKASSAAGEVLAQRGAQPQQVTSTFPDQRLVGAGGHLDRLSLRAVPGHRPQLAGVGAHHARQGVRVSLIALSPGGAVPFPVPATCRGLTASTV
jgi:hypothetical protein